MSERWGVTRESRHICRHTKSDHRRLVNFRIIYAGGLKTIIIIVVVDCRAVVKERNLDDRTIDDDFKISFAFIPWIWFYTHFDLINLRIKLLILIEEWSDRVRDAVRVYYAMNVRCTLMVTCWGIRRRRMHSLDFGWMNKISPAHRWSLGGAIHCCCPLVCEVEFKMRSTAWSMWMWILILWNIYAAQLFER